MEVFSCAQMQAPRASPAQILLILQLALNSKRDKHLGFNRRRKHAPPPEQLAHI